MSGRDFTLTIGEFLEADERFEAKERPRKDADVRSSDLVFSGLSSFQLTS